MNSTGRVQSIDRAIAVLKCFSENTRELKLSDISDHLDLNKSTVHGIISTLKFHGFINQDEETQKYRLGLALMELGTIVINSFDIRSIVAPVINDICNQVQETVHLGTLDNIEVVYIEKKESSHSMRIFTNIGARQPAYCTGIGKAMIAYLEPDALIALLPEEIKKFTPKTITDKIELTRELSKVKKNGYAIDDEENSEGLKCVGAPIFDHTGKAKYAISVSGPTIRMTEDKIQETIKLLTNATKEISHKLGYRE